MGEFISLKDKDIWSPSYVLQDPMFDHSNKHKLQNSIKNHHHHHHKHYGGFQRPNPFPLQETLPLNYTRQNQQSNRPKSKGKGRMQAFFLVPPGRTGTGVFLPNAPTKKSACSQVLIPAHVVKALNLNTHNNVIHSSHPTDIRENNSKKKKQMLGMPMKTEVETPIEKLLPEEWIY